MFALLAVLFAPVAYILSIGPAWRLYHHGTIKRDTFYSIYLPLLRVVASEPSLKRAVEGYGAIWLLDWPAEGGSKPELSSE